MRPGRSVSLLLILAWAAECAVPSLKEHFGFVPGDDYKLAGYSQVVSYFQKMAASSSRMKLVEFGKSAEGRAMYVAFISDPDNLKHLDRYRDISRRLALGLAPPGEAPGLAASGKAIVWIDSGLHATEVAPVQQAPHLAYLMLTGESEEVKRIRRNVILMQVPVINPDGLDAVVNWYRQNAGTPYEIAPLPRLYHKYAGHDNNRDWFMFNLVETRNVSRLLFEEWFPQIVYNQHQQGPTGPRFSVPPYDDPLNPNIPSPVMEGISLIGTAIRERLAREGKPGVVSYLGYDAWWNGGLRTAPAFHNMHGILTEAANYAYATPRVFHLSDLPDRLRNGLPNKEPSIFQQRPWMGGKWGVSDSIAYMLSADLAILDLAAGRSSQFLTKAWEMARANIEAGKKGKPFAYIVAQAQHDPSEVDNLLWRLRAAGVEVRRARQAFTAGGKPYPPGTLLIEASQAFRGYLMDLLEPQKYPEIRSGPSGSVKRPYDLAGWTLSFQMGVAFDRVDEPFEVSAEPVTEFPKPGEVLDHRQNASFLTMAAMLSKGQPLRWAADGAILSGTQGAAAWRIQQPRVALYEPWTANMDTGWTQWLLDQYQVPHTLVHNTEVRAGDLRARYDSILLAAQPMASLLEGFREGEAQGSRGGPLRDIADPKSLQRPEYTGGIGLEGALALRRFVEAGGTLVAFDDATELPVRMFPLGVRELLSGETASGAGWSCPGSVLRVDVDNTHPLAFGMPAQAYVTSTGGQAFELTRLPEFEKANVVARYAKKDLLASGWVSGERAVLGKAALVDARLGQGRIVLFGFRPQFRGQSTGTFKFILNALYLSAAKPL